MELQNIVITKDSLTEVLKTGLESERTGKPGGQHFMESQESDMT